MQKRDVCNFDHLCEKRIYPTPQREVHRSVTDRGIGADVQAAVAASSSHARFDRRPVNLSILSEIIDFVAPEDCRRHLLSCGKLYMLASRRLKATEGKKAEVVFGASRL